MSNSTWNVVFRYEATVERLLETTGRWTLDRNPGSLFHLIRFYRFACDPEPHRHLLVRAWRKASSFDATRSYKTKQQLRSAKAMHRFTCEVRPTPEEPEYP